MRHSVDEVVNPVAVRQRSHGLRILRRVGVLPGVADIGIKIDSHYHPVLVIINSAPGRLGPLRFAEQCRRGAVRLKQVEFQRVGYLNERYAAPVQERLRLIERRPESQVLLASRLVLSCGAFSFRQPLREVA